VIKLSFDQKLQFFHKLFLIDYYK